MQFMDSQPALFTHRAQFSRLGASMGAAQSFKELGDMAGPLLIGLLTQFYGVRAGFVTCGALALLFLLALVSSGVVKQGGEGQDTSQV